MFNWSTLDRTVLIDILWLARFNIVGHPMTPVEFSSKIRDHLKLFQIPINVRSRYRKETGKNAVWIGGVYEIDKDQSGITPITLRLQFNTADQILCINKSNFRRICYTASDTILHEIIHMRQYRRRNYKDIPGYASKAQSRKKLIEQEYLGNYDEIDAYAFNISCALRDKFKNDDQKVMEYLDQNLQGKKLKKNSYNMYLETFDHNHNHTVIRKLKRKIIYYLPYAALGKPYKTSDWLTS